MHESDRNRMTKLQQALLLAARDMDQAEAAVHALDAETENVALMRALETAIAVTYARAFTQSNLHTLADEWAPLHGPQLELHTALIDLRDQRYAHTDRPMKSGRRPSITVVEIDAQTFEYQTGEEWMPLPREALPEITALLNFQRIRFQAKAAEIQLQLQRLDQPTASTSSAT
jgi:hypothetical protein